MSRSKWLVVIPSTLGIAVMLGVLTQCGVMQFGDSATVTALPTNAVIPENTMRVVKVTQTEAILSTTLPSTPSETPIAFTMTAGPTSTPFPTVPAGIPILSPGGSGAASNLLAEPRCRDNEPISVLSWTLATEHGSAQRIDVATYIGGFEANIFETTGPFPADQSSAMWEKVGPGVLHFWRVLTLQRNGWVPSEVGSFNGLVCIADSVSTSLP